MKLYHLLLSNKGLQTVTQTQSKVGPIVKKLKNEPFIKTLFLGKYLDCYLKFPEFSANDLNKLKSFTQAIQASTENFKRNESNYASLNESLKQLKLYSKAFPSQYGTCAFLWSFLVILILSTFF
jgi:hypothetical protein